MLCNIEVKNGRFFTGLCLFVILGLFRLSYAANYTILAANDLGMHCADQDFRIFSILPPYNVLNAQVLLKGREPELMSPQNGIQVTYRAVNSNYFSDLTDPARLPDATDSLTRTGANLPGIFKSNFWETVSGKTFITVLLGDSFFQLPVAAGKSSTGIDKIGFVAYESLYPPGILALFPSTPDTGLPAPDIARLYLGDNTLHAGQSLMPGLDNIPRPFHNFVENYPFFVDFPFGYTVNNFNRYTAEGIPVSAVDDSGRSNPYPLMRVEARDQSGNVLASVDAVVPVASEADCAICHASQEVCDINLSNNALVCDDIANMKYSSVDFIETSTEASQVIGETAEQKVINSAKLNIVRLHDFKHGTSLAGSNANGLNANGTSKNIVCASCHYSPALDLAHLGPNEANGKEQTRHISMSRAMHSVHGNLPKNDPSNYGDLFPIMPPPGSGRDPVLAQNILMETCYNCHPGKKAKCLRGAMGGSGTVCQDCHGQMTQVGDDFTENFPDIPFPQPGSADLSKRVPWASEPACDSCHIGDVMQAKALNLTDVVVNDADIYGNPDGIRLLQSYKLSDHIANGGSTRLSIMKFPNSRFATTAALYRLSGANNASKQGHEGLSCEGCHGSTHAIWPNINPNANDNQAAIDLQGHSGTIIECSTCHEGNLGNTLDGPHGMHPVGDTSFSRGGHEHMAEHNPDACRACHGLHGEGSVLSRAATDRILTSDDDKSSSIALTKGDRVSCTLCHKNKL